MATASQREQILAHMAALLVGATPAGNNVFRSREVSITRAIAPAITVMPAANSLERMATELDRNQFEAAVEVFVRGDPWDSLADPINVAAHAALMADAPLRQLVTDIRRIAEDFESIEADKTAGTLTLRYRITFTTRANDISATF